VNTFTALIDAKHRALTRSLVQKGGDPKTDPHAGVPGAPPVEAPAPDKQ
jgi:hypothetical protein